MFHANIGDMPDREFSKIETRLNRAEATYEKFCLASADCRLYAERLIANLADKNPKYQFAAHTDLFGHPPNSCWRVLVRSVTGKAITSEAFASLQRSAKAILRNVEKQYPGEGKKAQEVAEKAHVAKLAKQGVIIKKVDGGVRVSVKGRKNGCMSVLVLLVASALGLTLAVVL
jgi:hypothetical protein